MLDREKVETILQRRFSGASRDQLAAAVNAIMGLSDEWEEVVHENQPFGHHFSNQCGQLCYLTADLADGIEFRLFRRRDPACASVVAAGQLARDRR
jgi:hypothetical protein